jgi:hypothetical protein
MDVAVVHHDVGLDAHDSAGIAQYKTLPAERGISTTYNKHLSQPLQ